MHCSHCGICCEETEMMLSDADVAHLEAAGYNRQKFVRYDKDGFARLRNRRGFCVFYDLTKRRCSVYKHRPEGCRIYPVILSEQQGILVDDLCPMGDTVSGVELKRKGRGVRELLRKMGDEAASRKVHLT